MRDQLVFWAVGSLVKGTALLLVVFLVASALRRTSAGLRHLVWSGGIVGLLLLPFVSLTLPWRLPVATPSVITALVPADGNVTPLRPVAAGPAGSDVPTATTLQTTAAPASLSPAVPAPAVTDSSWNLSRAVLLRLLFWVWLGGVALITVRLILGAAVVRRIVRRAAPLESPDWNRPLLEGADRLALDRVPRLLLSDRLPMPFACGVLHPAIVLPAGAAEWTDRRRRAVLCHELAHIRRFDLLLNALGQAACVLYWFHPLVWMAVRRLRMESERACDDLVLGVGTRPSEYADHLLQIVCRAARSRTPSLALPMAERREFEGRMLAILERDASRDPASRRHAFTLAMFAAALVVPLAALGPARVTVPTPTAFAGEQRVAPQLSDQGTPAKPRPSSSEGNQQSVAPENAKPRADGDAVSKPVKEREPAPTKQQVVQSSPERQTEKWDQSRGKETDPKVVAALAAALEDDVASVREDAAYALGQLEAREAVPALGTRLDRDPGARVRKMAAWSLGQIESKDAIPMLGRAAMQDAAVEVRAMAVWALGQLNDPAAMPALAGALRDSSTEVRGRAAWAMGQIESKEAPEGLKAALHDGSADVRYRAAWALGQIGDPTSVAALSGALKDNSPEVRKAALWALGQMRGDAAQPALLEALKDPDPEVRARAARALAGQHSDPWPWPWPMPIIR